MVRKEKKAEGRWIEADLVLAHRLGKAGDPSVLDLRVDDNQVGLAGGKDPLSIGCDVNSNDGICGGGGNKRKMKKSERKEKSGKKKKRFHLRTRANGSWHSC